MDSTQSTTPPDSTQVATALDSKSDDHYLKIWEVEQAHERHRWTITTFFVGLSFGAASFSFQSTLEPTSAIALRVGAVAIWWFACIFFTRFSIASEVLRTYLHHLEDEGKTTFRIQSTYWQALRKRLITKVSALQILVAVGVVYTGALLYISLA